jgi:two-component system, CitB family, sensor kinase
VRHPWSIARRMAVAQMGLLAVVAMFSLWALQVQGHEIAQEVEERHLVGVATLLAQDRDLVEGLQGPNPTAALQPLVQGWMEDAELTWLSVLDVDGTRLASWSEEQVGSPYPRPVQETVAGNVVTEVSATGPAGQSVRAVAPVRAGGAGQEVLGVIVVGVPLTELEGTVQAQLPQLFWAFAAMAAVTLGAAWLLHGYLSRVTLGRGPEELASDFLLSAAAMDSVGAAVLVLSPEGRLRLHNTVAADAFGLPLTGSRPDGGGLDGGRSDRGEPDPQVALPPELAAVLLEHDEPEFAASVGDRVFMVRQRWIGGRGRRRSLRLNAALAAGVQAAPAGTRVVLLHDRTELRRLGDELSVARTLTSALRAQTHEHANRLHTALSLIESGRTGAAMAVLARRQHTQTQQDEVLVALLEGKEAEAAERGVSLTHRLQVRAPSPVSPLDAITLVGNLVDNALDAASAPGLTPDRRWIDVELRCDASGLLLQVADGGAGPEAEADLLFSAGYSTKPAGAAGRGVGLALVRSVAEAAGGHVELATDSGTVFTVEIPPAAAMPEPAGKEQT